MSVNDSRQFVEAFHEGDPVAAVFAIARAHGLGVHVVTVEDVAEAADKAVDDLSAEEREEVGEKLAKYDEWLANSGAQDSIVEFRFGVAEECGLVEDD